jgi:hypothetical protein
MADDDCDGMVDEGVAAICYPDSDGDTYAPSGAASSSQCRELLPDQLHEPGAGGHVEQRLRADQRGDPPGGDRELPRSADG